jgi:hypothetical protein
MLQPFKYVWWAVTDASDPEYNWKWNHIVGVPIIVPTAEPIGMWVVQSGRVFDANSYEF